jgi:hypothetical protein
MKRLMSAVLFTLVLSALVAPGAKAIRPELLPERVHPTIHTDNSAESKPVEMAQQPTVQASMPKTQEQKPVEEVKRVPESDNLPFGFFENYYRQHYGN